MHQGNPKAVVKRESADERTPLLKGKSNYPTDEERGIARQPSDVSEHAIEAAVPEGAIGVICILLLGK
jgi:hypothetical protein